MLRCLLLLSLLAPPSLAQRFIHWFDGTFKAAQEEARSRNVPLLIAFIMDGEEANDRIVNGLYKDAGFIKLTSRCVPLVASQGTHPKRKQVVDGHTRSVCRRFGAISCSQHRQIEWVCREKYWKETVITPSHIMALPDGTEVARILDVAGTDRFAEALKTAQNKLGRGLSRKTYREVQQELRLARSELRGEKLQAAIQRLLKLDSLLSRHPLQRRVKKLLAELETRGQRRIQRAQALARQKKTLEALRLLDESLASFKGSSVWKQQQKARKQLLATKAGRAAARLLHLEKLARPDFDKAKAAARQAEWGRAARLYERVIKRAGGTPLARDATRRLKAMQEDPDIQSLLQDARRESQAQKRLRQALQLLHQGQQAAGRKQLLRLTRDYPGTTAARKARKILEKDS